MKLGVTKVAHLMGHRSAIYALTAGTQPAVFYTGDSAGHVAKWDLNKGTDGSLAADTTQPVYSLFCDPDHLACGTARGVLHLLPAAGQKDPRQVQAHENGLFSIAKRGNRLLTSGGDGAIRAWDLQSLAGLAGAHDSEKSGRCIALSPDQKLLAAGFSDRKVRIYDATALSLIHTIDAHAHSVFATAWSLEGDTLLSAGRDAMLKTFDAKKDFSPIAEIPAHTMQITSVAVHPRGALIATTSMDKSIRLWSYPELELVKVINREKTEGHTHCVNKAIWTDEETLVTCSDDRSVIVWKIN